MGFSYAGDDTYMCFNSAKSWQLGWYSNNAVTIDAGGLRVYEGDIAGVTEDPFNINVPQVIKLNTPSYADFILNFNRKSGFNSDTQKGFNQVMITTTAGNGYSVSLLLAELSAGDSWTSDAVFSGESVTVTVKSIGTRTSVKICVGTYPTVTDIPSTSPSTSPDIASTGAPSSMPSVSPSASPAAATGTPSNAPASSSFYIEGTKSKFLLRRKNGQPIIKKCKYLQKLKEEGTSIKKICEATESTKKKEPAKDVCQVTCETCPCTCVELESAKAYFKTVDTTDHKTIKCGSLAKKSEKSQAKVCAINVSPISSDITKVVCPVTCKQC